MNRDTQRAKAEAFRAMHDRSRILVLPNAWDAMSARVALEETRKCSVQVALRAGLQHLNLETKGRPRRLHIADIRLVTRVIWIDQDTDRGRFWNEVMQNPDLLLQELRREERDAGEVPAGTIQATDKP